MTRDEKIRQAYKDYMDNGGMLQSNLWFAFKAGAEWAENNHVNVWHDASEVPQENEYALIQYDENDYDVTLTQSTDEWDTWCDTCKIIRWAYIEDLLPKQSGNSEQLKGGEK